jgi:hypothetical protein
MLEHFEHRDRVECPVDVFELRVNLDSGTRAPGIGAINTVRVESEQATHLEKLAEAATEIEDSADAEVTQPQDVLDVVRRIVVTPVIAFELADGLVAHPAREANRVPFG